MTKLRKRMILLKTSHLLKENELVLFYHDPSNGNGHNKTKISSKLATKKFLQSYEPEIFAECEPSFEAISKRNVLQVKNKIGIKAIRLIFFPFFQKTQPTLIDSQFRLLSGKKACQLYKDQNRNFLQSSIFPFQKNKNNFSESQAMTSNLQLPFEAKLCKKAHSTMSDFPDKVEALLQGGGTIIIGVKKLASVHQNTIDSVTSKACHIPEKIWSDDKNLLLMGGIYRAQLVNIKTLKRLWNLGPEKIYYQKLTIFLRKEILRIFLKYYPFQSIHKHTFCVFSCLQFKWILLICILKNYNNSKVRRLHFGVTVLRS